MNWTRRMQTALALAITAGLLFVGTSAGAQDEPSVITSEFIQITTTPEPYDGPCMSRAQALSNTTTNNATHFILTIKVAGDLCTPINDAKAVIYRMPGPYGNAWPQTLVEQLDFTVEHAGTIEVKFTKTCAPVQFDVITGGTPDVIGDPTKLPLPPFHGPLLFPTDSGTALQFWGLDGEECEPEAVQFEFLGPECVNDFPYIRWNIVASGIEPAPTTATITIKDKDGNIVKDRNGNDLVLVRPLSGRIIWPGASESPPDWPGWKLVNGNWEIDTTDQVLREGLIIEAEVNPTATGTVSYPAATAACASPTQFQATTTTTTTTTTLVGDPTMTGGGPNGGGTSASSSSGVPLSVAG